MAKRLLESVTESPLSFEDVHFHCESHDYLRHGSKKLTTAQLKKLQEKTF